MSCRSERLRRKTECPVGANAFRRSGECLRRSSERLSVSVEICGLSAVTFGGAGAVAVAILFVVKGDAFGERVAVDAEDDSGF